MNEKAIIVLESDDSYTPGFYAGILVDNQDFYKAESLVARAMSDWLVDNDREAPLYEFREDAIKKHLDNAGISHEIIYQGTVRHVDTFEIEEDFDDEDEEV